MSPCLAYWLHVLPCDGKVILMLVVLVALVTMMGLLPPPPVLGLVLETMARRTLVVLLRVLMLKAGGLLNKCT